MVIDRIFRKVKSYLNTDGIGNFRPTDFNDFLHDAIQERNEEYLGDYNRHLNRQNRGLMSNFLENLPERTQEKINHYLTTATLAMSSANTRVLPDNLRYIDEVETSDGITLEMCKNRKEFNILKNTANSTYPIFYKNENELRIAPDNSGDMSITYLRNPNYPKWTYNIVDGFEIFNSSANDFVDADIHQSEEDEMVRRVLLRFGVNLKDQQVQAFAINDEDKEFNKNNQS